MYAPLIYSPYCVTADTLPVDIRQKAIEVTLSLTSGAYQTSLLSYFTHRDLFPSLMKVWIGPISLVQDTNRSSSYKTLILQPELLSHLHSSAY